MKVRATLMIQDPAIADLGIGRLVEDWKQIDEPHYLDGPVTPRVAVVDLDPDTEGTVPGAEFLAPSGRRTLGAYRVNKGDIYSPNFIQVSVFGTVLRTMYLFEEDDALGRKIDWAFDAPQLLIVPRAGWWANAYYERRSHSLQFFSFRSGSELVHTSLSRDIVAHETAHSLIDGVAPDLYDALDTQGLALHEGLADLVAMLVGFRSGNLVDAVLRKTNGSIADSTEFSSIGVQFGRALDPTGHGAPLRNLRNRARLRRNQDPATEPEAHELSLVVSGALYEFMVYLHETTRKRLATERQQPEFTVSGLALFEAAERFKRTILRGLDYLPSGELAFIDFARAMLAADQASYPVDEDRAWLVEELVRRGIAKSAGDLSVETNFENPNVAAADLQGLVDSQWVAYTFADKNRQLLGIPDDAQVEVLPRRVVTKQYYLGDYHMTKKTTPVKELLFKVRWSETEPNPPDLGAAPTRRIQTGTTLVIDWDRKIVRTCMRPFDLHARRPARDATLRRLMEQGLINVTRPLEPAAATQAVGTGIDAVVTNGILRVHNTARLLHIAKDAADG